MATLTANQNALIMPPYLEQDILDYQNPTYASISGQAAMAGGWQRHSDGATVSIQSRNNGGSGNGTFAGIVIIFDT